jgi:cyanate permease
VAGWDASDVGSLIAVLGLASIPVSFAVGAASARLSDRALTAAALLAGVIGCALLTQAGHADRSVAYFAGAPAR